MLSLFFNFQAFKKPLESRYKYKYRYKSRVQLLHKIYLIQPNRFCLSYFIHHILHNPFVLLQFFIHSKNIEHLQSREQKIFTILSTCKFGLLAIFTPARTETRSSRKKEFITKSKNKYKSEHFQSWRICKRACPLVRLLLIG